MDISPDSNSNLTNSIINQIFNNPSSSSSSLSEPITTTTLAISSSIATQAQAISEILVTEAEIPTSSSLASIFNQLNNPQSLLALTNSNLSSSSSGSNNPDLAQIHSNHSASISLDPLLTTFHDQNSIANPNHQIHLNSSQPILTITATTKSPKSKSSKQILPKSKISQCNLLKQAAQSVLDSVWETLSNVANHDLPSLQISKKLDDQFDHLHDLVSSFKPDDLALIWPQSIPHRSVKKSFQTGRSIAYFAIRKANIALISEYILTAMPGAEAYGQNDLVFACEGFLPLIVDPELILDQECWQLCNELKVQIYIQRLDKRGIQEANLRVLPNLFVESLSSYSGVQVPDHIETLFEALAAETKAQIVSAATDLDLLRTNHPYNRFATWALDFLQRSVARLDAKETECQITSSILNTPSKPSQRKRKQKDQCLSSNQPLPVLSTNADDDLLVVNNLRTNYQQPDISVEQTHQEEINHESEPDHKRKYNPYRLGRGKGVESAPRRRWTQDEYELLLEEVRLYSNKYDCMAQIIKRHGKNGEISDIFKDQNNVSLKDKARNLTLEWQRHGYPEDKPWLKEAFARFSSKGVKRSVSNEDHQDQEDEPINPEWSAGRKEIELRDEAEKQNELNQSFINDEPKNLSSSNDQLNHSSTNNDPNNSSINEELNINSNEIVVDEIIVDPSLLDQPILA
ncbi:hypothetical protein O181_065710 [Austropuccinia psidii MF-1]|uniref:Myb-like domain-containing protein n=1 Tax=Austropuccinia psidii MF-1 TaxID=1389203 RepID=A0A9Q3EVL6_9BASI|nr:hypothetical protein [Austropuccinia psidii MF-1]